MILVGQDPASQVYVRNKIRDCAAGGVGPMTRAMLLHDTLTSAERAVQMR